MDNQDTKSTIALVISILALGLSGYVTLGNAGLLGDAGEGETGSDFSQKVRTEIEAYVDEQRQAAAGPAASAPAAKIDPSTLPDDDAVKGDEDAPVTIVEFSDYQCPYCGRFFNDTLPELREKYIDTGKVKHVFRDFPLGFHADAMPAASAAECVREQGGDEAYFAYHDLLFQNQQALDADSLKKYAEGISGVDADKLAECIDTNQMQSEVQADFVAGQQAGVQGTPAFFVNGRLISGAQPFSVFEAIIEEELSK